MPHLQVCTLPNGSNYPRKSVLQQALELVFWVWRKGLVLTICTGVKVDVKVTKGCRFTVPQSRTHDEGLLVMIGPTNIKTSFFESEKLALASYIIEVSLLTSEY